MMYLKYSLLALCLISSTCFAKRTSETVSSKVHAILLEAQTLNAKNAHHKALKTLDSIKLSSLTPFEVSQIWNIKGFTHYSQERYTRAINAFKQSLKHTDLSRDIKLNTLQTVSQIYFLTERYANAIAFAKQYIQLDTQHAQLYALKAQSHYQLNQFRSAANAMQTALKLKREQHKNILENDLLILSACYQEMEQSTRQVNVLKQLIALYPKKRYFLALSGAYYESGNSHKQLAIYETLYEKNWLTEPRQISNLAQLYLLNGSPHKAAIVIQDAFKNKSLKRDTKHLKLLARAWYAARTPGKAIPPLKQVASWSKNGREYLKLGYLFSQMERWDDAIEAFNLAKKKGGLPKKNNVNLLKGIACYYAGHHNKARKAFKQAIAQQHYASTAKSWLNILNQREDSRVI